MNWFDKMRAVALLIVTTTGLVALALGSPAGAQQREREPGEQVICIWAIYGVAAEVGKRCHANEDPGVQAELQRSLSRIREYVLANSDPAVTPEQVETFERNQTHSDAPQDAAFCRGDAEQLYQSITEQGEQTIRTSTDDLLARPGNPSWGTCF